MLSSFIIRRATESDAAEILRCLASAFEPYRASYTSAAYLDTILSAETILHRLRSMQVFVAVTSQNEVIGTIAGVTTNVGDGHLRGMAVMPQCQGFKVAEGLLRTVEDGLKSQGCSRITLDTTEPLLRAMRFYEKNGYRRSGKVVDFFGMPLHEFVKQL